MSEKEKYLIDLAVGASVGKDIETLEELDAARQAWIAIRESEVEEAMDNQKWRPHYPNDSRDKVRKLLPGDVLKALASLEAELKAAPAPA